MTGGRRSLVIIPGCLHTTEVKTMAKSVMKLSTTMMVMLVTSVVVSCVTMMAMLVVSVVVSCDWPVIAAWLRVASVYLNIYLHAVYNRPRSWTQVSVPKSQQIVRSILPLIHETHVSHVYFY